MDHINEKGAASKLLMSAGVLLLAAGVLMVFCMDIVIAAMLWGGAFCLFGAGYNFRITKKDKEDES